MRKKHPKGKEYNTFTNLELKLMAIIINSDYSNKDLDFFKSKIVSDYIDHSHLYRLSVEYDQDQLTDIILNSGKFDINDGELYMDVGGCIMFGGDDRIKKHLKNGYVPSKNDVEGILDAYCSEVDLEHDEEVFKYFIMLYKNMHNEAPLSEREINALQLTIAEILKDENIADNNLQYFKSKLVYKELGWGLLYNIAVAYNKTEFSDLIIAHNNYKLADNADEEMLKEVIACIAIRSDKHLLKYLNDGYYPNDVGLTEIMDFYSLLERDTYNIDIFNLFNQMYKQLKIKRIKREIENAQTIIGV
jgi:hypothetical protein